MNSLNTKILFIHLFMVSRSFFCPDIIEMRTRNIKIPKVADEG